MRKCLQSFFKCNISQRTKTYTFFIVVLPILLIISGTVHTNPGPVKLTKTKLSFAVRNLDSIPARDYAIIRLIEPFQATYDFDIFGVCESRLNKDIRNDDINISGFSAEPFRADKLENSRCGDVCLYYKENLPIKERPDLVPIPETIVAELKFQRKKIFFVLSYCHPNLTISEFAEYTKSLENIYESINKENPTMTIMTGDFNARSSLFWENDTENSRGRTLSN